MQGSFNCPAEPAVRLCDLHASSKFQHRAVCHLGPGDHAKWSDSGAVVRCLEEACRRAHFSRVEGLEARAARSAFSIQAESSTAIAEYYIRTV